MLASFDPVKKLNMELLSDSELSSASYAKGIIKFQGIFYSDCKNLLAYASKYDKFWLTSSCVEIVVKELQSILKEYESKPGNSDLLHSQVQESSLKPKGKAKAKAKLGSDHGIGITDARLPLSISSAERITNSSYCNSEEQYLRGLINNQTGYVLGNGNGSYIVRNDRKFSVYNGN